jgi:hypothetical protein
MAKYHSSTHAASDPGRIRLSRRRFRQLEPTARGIRGFFWLYSEDGRTWQERIDEHLQQGDSRAALVFSVEPLIVGAYSDEFDSTVMLEFPTWLNRVHRLQVGSKLLTVNTYSFMGGLAPDMMKGANGMTQFANVHPLIADFYSDDRDRIAARKCEIDDVEWERCLQTGKDYAQRFPGVVRPGTPIHARLGISQANMLQAARK